MIANEVDILRDLDHPNILKLYEVFEDDDSVYLVTELLSGGELFKIAGVNKGPEKKTASYVNGIVEALKYMHSKNILHRDLKLQNVLLKEPFSDEVKLADFGLACRIGSPEQANKCGTPGYLAPEVILDRNPGPKSDYFSLGVCLFIM